MQIRRIRDTLLPSILGLWLLTGCGGSHVPESSGTNPFAESRSAAPPTVPSPTSTPRTPRSLGHIDSSQADATVQVDGIDKNMPAGVQSGVVKVAKTPRSPSAPRLDSDPASPQTTAIPKAAEIKLPQARNGWPQFRGPGGQGISDETNLPERWSDTENVVWKAKLPGPGSSSPIVWGDRVFVTYYTGSPSGANESEQLNRYLACFDLDSGEQLWETEPVPQLGKEEPLQRSQAKHGYASSTPCTDGRHIYCFFGTSGAAAFDWDGQLVWHNKTAAGKEIDSWGSGSSPIHYEDLVIINACVESESLVALNQDSGRVEWTAVNVQQSWATPVVVDVPGREPELVLNTKHTLVGLHPLTGDVLWYTAGVPDYVCPSVVAMQGTVFAIGGRSGTALAVQAGGRGEISDGRVIWRASKGSNVPSPVVHDGYLYWVNEAGVAFCLSTLDGRVVKQSRLHIGDVYASIVAADGKLYVVSRNKGACVLSATPQLTLIAKNSFESDTSTFNASPAVASGRILLRSDTHLYCLGKP